MIKVRNKEITPDTIWMCRQNIPELVVEDCISEFKLTEEQADKLRFILMIRGVNKWLYARRRFIDLKHEVKRMLNDERIRIESNRSLSRDKYKLLQIINEKMQNIAKMPRWIEFPKTTTHNWDKIEEGIVIKGRKC